MQLPINGERLPVREKYLIDETPMFSNWFVFGEHEDGRVDVSNGEADVFVRLPPALAEKLIASRDRFVKELVELLALYGPKGGRLDDN